MGYALRLFASMPSSPKFDCNEEQYQHKQQQQKARHKLDLSQLDSPKRQSQDTAEEKMEIVSELAASLPRRKQQRSTSSGYLVEALEEEEIRTPFKRRASKILAPIGESEEILHDLAENLQSAVQRGLPRSPPAPPPMQTSPSPPRCEQHMNFNAARRKARVRAA